MTPHHFMSCNNNTTAKKQNVQHH